MPEPAARRRWWWYFLGSNRSVLAGLAGLLLVLTYFVLAGRPAARFPDRGAVAKCGDPAGRTPAELRVLRTGRCDGRAFVATVVRMAVKGYLVIEERGGAYSLSLGRADGVELAPEEALAAGDLDLERIGRVGIDRANDGRIGGAINDLKNILRISTERTHLLRNRDYLLPGLALSVVVLVSTLTFEPGLRLFIGGLISVLLFFWTIGVSLLAYQLVCRWKDVLLRRGHPRHALFHAVSMTVFAVPVALAELADIMNCFLSS